ncbi:MAG: twin-arginine translocase subunit TatB [Gammaproteobacteria bacterium]|nr:twin-arginine translocase subunit TatB [Gammaproteobacteria bacterium]
MFDIGFWELALVGLVALLVLGPERLPAFARTVGRWVGKAQRLTREFKRDLEREIDLSELRQLKQDLQAPELDALAQDLQKGADEFNRELNQPLVFGPTAPTATSAPAVADTTAAAAPPPTKTPATTAVSDGA